jgi:lipopolysaccharide/colanic/teichoic acid biosynthesis glycosyltransferase
MYKKYIKRILDIVISLLTIILLIPIYSVIAILIKLIDKNDVFFTQVRTGIKGKKFKIYKFRTMKNGKITKLGKILRNTSLDETPQFFNVLKGDMSIVGPRPWVPDYYENFNKEQKKRANVRPRFGWFGSSKW